MEHQFDSLAKSVSGAVSRRQALWRLGSGLALSLLGAVGLAARGQGNRARCCTQACRNLNPPPPDGQAFAVCIRHCLETGDVGDLPVCS